MDFSAMEQNLRDNILEAQLKLGYSRNAMSFNYMLPTLRHLLHTDAEGADMAAILEDFAAYVSPRLGSVTFRSIGKGFCISVPAEGAEFVHANPDEGAGFLRALLQTVRQSGATLDDVRAVFRQFSGDAVTEDSPDPEFDLLCYFPSGKPNAYRFCFTAEEEMDGSMRLSYHRFLKEDYDDFGFGEN